MDRNIDLTQFSWALKYSQYVELRNNGQRKTALKLLNEFIDDFNTQPVDIKRKFINEVCTIAFLSNDFSTYIPENLNRNLFKSEINRWIQDEPENPLAYKWTFDIDLLRKSLVLDPKDQISLSMFGKMAINKISLNQHEIKEGYNYDGDPINDLELISFYEKLNENINDMDERNKNRVLLRELKKGAMKFI